MFRDQAYAVGWSWGLDAGGVYNKPQGKPRLDWGEVWTLAKERGLQHKKVRSELPHSSHSLSGHHIRMLSVNSYAHLLKSQTQEVQGFVLNPQGLRRVSRLAEFLKQCPRAWAWWRGAGRRSEAGWYFAKLVPS